MDNVKQIVNNANEKEYEQNLEYNVIIPASPETFEHIKHNQWIYERLWAFFTEKYARKMSDKDIKHAVVREKWTPEEAGLYLFGLTIPMVKEYCKSIRYHMGYYIAETSSEKKLMDALKSDLADKDYYNVDFEQNLPFIMEAHTLGGDFVKSLPIRYTTVNKNVFFFVNLFLKGNYHKEYKKFTNHKLIDKVKDKFKKDYNSETKKQKDYKNNFPFLYQESFSWIARKRHLLKALFIYITVKKPKILYLILIIIIIFLLNHNQYLFEIVKFLWNEII